MLQVIVTVPRPATTSKGSTEFIVVGQIVYCYVYSSGLHLADSRILRQSSAKDDSHPKTLKTEHGDRVRATEHSRCHRLIVRETCYKLYRLFEFIFNVYREAAY